MPPVDLAAARAKAKAKRNRAKSKPKTTYKPKKRYTLSRPTPDQQDRNRARKVHGPPAPTPEQRRNQRAIEELRRKVRSQVAPTPAGRGGLETRDYPEAKNPPKRYDVPSRGSQIALEKERRSERHALKRARKNLRILTDKRASDKERTRARLSLQKLGILDPDRVTPNEGGDRSRIVERYITPGAVSTPFLRDAQGRERRVYGRIGNYKDRRDPKFERFVGRALSGLFSTGNLATQTDPKKLGQRDRAGLLPDPVGNAVDRTLKKGLTVAGEGALQALVRPGRALESALGKGLVEVGAIKDDRVTDVGHRIRKARGPIDVLLHGAREKDVTGGDIAEGLGLPRQTGIGIDIATDPLMWFGVGALPKGSAVTASALSRRISESGIAAAREALQGAKVTSLAERAALTGDADPLLGELRRIAKEHGISTRALGRTRAERRAKKEARQAQKAARIDETRQIIEDLRAGRTAGEESLEGRNLYVPDVPGMEAVASVARLAKQRETRPGFRLRLLDPLGFERGSIPVPIPKRIADLPLTGGVVLSNRTRELLGRMRMAERGHAETVAHQAGLREVEEGRKKLNERLMQRIKEVGRERAHAELRSARETLDQMEKNIRQSYRERMIRAQDEEVEKARMTAATSLSDRVKMRNVRRMERMVAPTADEFGRTTQMRFYQQVLKGIEDHLGNLNNPKIVPSLEKIQLHRFARADTGSQSVLKKAGIKLTPQERAVMRELDKIDKQMAKFGMATGTLKRTLEDYGGPRIWNPEGVSVDQIVQNLNSRFGGASFFSRHRQQAAVSDLADPDRLANKIRELSSRELTPEQARDYADEWHQTGSIRFAQELMMRQEQRAGDTLMLDDLPKTFQRAAHLAEEMTPRGEEGAVPLLNIDREMGVAKLNRSDRARRAYGLPDRDPVDITPEQAIKSIDADLARIAYIRKTTKSGTQMDKDLRKWSRRLRVQRRQLEKEIEAARRATNEEDELSDMLALSVMDDAGQMYDEAIQEALEAGDWDEVSRLAGSYNAWKRDLARMQDEIEKRRIQNEEWGEGPEALGGPQDIVRNIDRILESAGGNPFDDVVDDITSRLPDFREENFFPILDMRNSYFYRTRSEGVNAAFRSRWKGIDAAEGRSVEETEALYRTADGTEGRVADLEQWEVPDNRLATLEAQQEQLDELGIGDMGADDLGVGDPRGFGKTFQESLDEARAEIGQPEPHVFWYDRRLDRVFEADEIQTTGPALVPNTSRTLFYDINTGREYAFPSQIVKDVGERIDDAIQPKGRDGKIRKTKVWPTDVIRAASAEAMRAGEYDIVFKTGLESGVGKVLSLLRYGVTSLFPAYHTRNMISDLLKSMQADSGVIFHPIVNAKMTAMAMSQGKMGGKINVKGIGEMNTEDFLLMADAFGLRSGHHVAEISRIADTGEYPVRGRLSRTARALGPSGAIGSKAVDFGVRREDVTRFMTFAQRMRRNGGDAADAMMYMIKHHFNYNDLTIYEKRNIRNLFLFYTWYRKNIPLQLAEIVHRPGFFSGVAHTYEALEAGETPINQNWSKIHPFFPNLSGKMPRRGTIPDYLQDRLASIGINWNGHAALFGFGAPWADLSLLDPSPEGLRDWISMMNPAFTTGVQLASEEELLTDREFKQDEHSGAANVIDSVLSAAGLDGLPTDDKGRPVLPWALTVVLRNTIPGLGRLFGTQESTSPTRDPGRLQKIGKNFSWAHGINVYVSPGKGTTREELALTNLVRGRAAERSEFLKSISNLPQEEAQKRLAEFDRQTLVWAKKRKIPIRVLRNVKATGFYEGPGTRRRGSGLGGGGGLGSGLGGGGLGG